MKIRSENEYIQALEEISALEQREYHDEELTSSELDRWEHLTAAVEDYENRMYSTWKDDDDE